MAAEPTHAERLLLVIGRNNPGRKSASIDALIQALETQGLAVHWYESKARETSRRLDELVGKFAPSLAASADHPRPALARRLRRLCKTMLLLAWPSRWDYLLRRRQEKHHTSIAELAAFIRQLEGRQVTLLTHSAGAIAGALVEHEAAIDSHICFGYPFKHPGHPEEPRRTQHLARIVKPFLIIQGDQDEYGTAAEARSYDLSPAIRLLSVRATHDYENIAEPDLDMLKREIRNFLSGIGRLSG